jgi:hypothetical protein
MYEITFIGTGRSVYWNETKARRHFGKDEWNEIKAGYLPHIVAVEVDTTGRAR